MHVFNKLISKFRRPAAKHVVAAAVFTLALAGSIGAGLTLRGTTSAIEQRQCGDNSIDNATTGGGCGALTPSEFVTDVKANKPSDLQTIYSVTEGLNSSNYTQFANTAKQGQTLVNGDIIVDGKTVGTNSISYGRQSFGNPHRIAEKVGSTTLYHSENKYSFAAGVTSIPVMVMFNDKGVVQAVVMNPCGNPVKTHPVVPTAACKNLIPKRSTTNPNTWTFTADATFSGNAVISRVVYDFGDGTTQTTHSLSTPTAPHTFTKNADVTVTVYATVPGGHEIKASAVASCAKHIAYTPPVFVCTQLVSTLIDDKTFRFTINTTQDVHTTVKDADFILDGSTTTSGVTTKDASGNIYKQYSFSDSVAHTVSATVYFNTLEGVKSDAGHCKATVTPKQQPMCTIPGRTNLPPDSPQCKYCLPGVPVGSEACTPKCTVPGHTTEAPDSPTCGYCVPNVPIGSPDCFCKVPTHTDELPTSSTCGYCKPGVPIGSADCTPTPPTPPTPPVTPPTKLVDTGPGQTTGLFVAVTIAGFFAHKFFLSRRLRREAEVLVTTAS